MVININNKYLLETNIKCIDAWYYLDEYMVFPVVIYGCESWTIKKSEHWRIDAFKLWCLRRLLRIPWTTRRWNQSILKEINPDYSLEGLMLKLKLHFFGHLMQRANSLEKSNHLLILRLSTVILEPKKIKSDAGKDWGQQEKGVTEDEMVGCHHGLSGH